MGFRSEVRHRPAAHEARGTKGWMEVCITNRAIEISRMVPVWLNNGSGGNRDPSEPNEVPSGDRSPVRLRRRVGDDILVLLQPILR